MNDFELIRPYTDQEVPSAIHRITRNRLFPIIVHYLLNKDVATMRRLCNSVHTSDEFQVRIMRPLLKEVEHQTTSHFSSSGFNQLNPQVSYLYISNHRDIVLDAAWLEVALYEAGFPLMEITFGSNLMSNQFNIDVGKLNKMFRLVRGGNQKEFYQNLLLVSQYMRHVITEKNSSVWIAQRNGRTKDGDDKTEVALLKMLAMSSKDTFSQNLENLNICPVAVSYEYEPCDFLKTAEVYISRRREYVKGKNEDMHSIKQGFIQFKGDVHFELTAPITIGELNRCESLGRQHCFAALAELIDKRIYAGYRLHKTNYIAYDMLYSTRRFAQYYSQSEQSDFENYMHEGFSNINISNATDELKNIFLNIYAMPVVNAIKCEAIVTTESSKIG